MIHFELTTAGLAALTTDQGTAAVQIRRIQLGSGGRDDLSAANRAALETPRDSAPVAGSAGSIDSGVLLSAEVAATAGYQVTEIGIWARIGDAGVEFLLAYWASSTPAAAAVTGVTLLVPAALQIVDAAADVTVTVSPSLTLAGVGTYLGLPDTPNALVAGAYQRVTSPNPVALESVSRAQVLDDLLGQLNGEGNTKVLRGGRSWYELLTAGGRVRPDRLGSNPDSTKILHGDGSWRSAPPFLIHVGGSGAVSADLIAGDRVRAVFAGIPVRDRSRAAAAWWARIPSFKHLVAGSTPMSITATY